MTARFTDLFSTVRILAMLLATAAFSIAHAKSADDSWTTTRVALLADLKRIDAPGLPGAVAAFNTRSFVVAAGNEGQSLVPVIAAGQMPGDKAGRIALFGHDGYLSAESVGKHDTGRLVARLARWVSALPEAPAAEHPRPIVGLIDRDSLHPFFEAEGWSVRKLEGEWTQNLDGLKLVVVTAGSVRSAHQAEAFRKFLNTGGGVLFGTTGWGWEQLNPGKTLVDDFVLTPVLAEAGLAVTAATAAPTDAAASANRIISDDELALVHASHALEHMKKAIAEKKPLPPEESGQVGTTLLLAARATRKDEPTFRKPLARLTAEHPRRMITSDDPVTKNDVLDRIAIRLDHETSSDAAPESIAADPSATNFPGPVPADAPRITKSIVFPAGSKGRMGTGLYAPPGGVVTIKVSRGTIPPGGRVRVGAHSDTLWHLDKWERHPEISSVRNFRTDSAKLAVSNAFGGLLYFESDSPLSAEVELTISGAVEAPHFVLGKTSQTEWDRLRRSEAPWAELQSRHVGLVLPSDSVRKLDDPRPLLHLWDKIIETQNELGPLGPAYMPTQWIVPDRQISAGYMHAGNPIMTWMDVVPFFVDPKKLLADKPGGVTWGILHEIGHNRQRPAWTPSGMGEVTNNLFALYVYDKMLGKPSYGHPGLLKGEARKKALENYRATGPDFEKFKADPFLALAFFMEIQEAIGWKPFIAYFEEVEKMPQDARPRTDTERWDAWLIGLSKQTRKELRPIFRTWGIPISESAEKSRTPAAKPKRSPRRK